MPPTYCESDVAIDNARDIVLNANKRFAQSLNQATIANNELQGLPANYSEVVTEINAQAAADPDSVAWQYTLGKKDEIVAERSELMANTKALVACFQAITDHGAAAVQAAVDAI